MREEKCCYVNPEKVSLDWECLVVSRRDMILDGLPIELINAWMNRHLLEPFQSVIMKLTLKRKIFDMHSKYRIGITSNC